MNRLGSTSLGTGPAYREAIPLATLAPRPFAWHGGAPDAGSPLGDPRRDPRRPLDPPGARRDAAGRVLRPRRHHPPAPPRPQGRAEGGAPARRDQGLSDRPRAR